MNQNLTHASRQWSSRPVDERFSNIQKMYEFCLNSATNSVTKNVRLNDLVAKNVDDNIVISDETSTLSLNNWSFEQLCKKISAPASYLSTLPTDKATDLVNYGIQQSKDRDTQLYLDGRTNVVRAVTSKIYKRLYNHEVIKAVMDFPGDWRTPPCRPAHEGEPYRLATEDDIVKNSLIAVGDQISAVGGGLYANDRNTFIFRIDNGTTIDDGSDQGLARGFFVFNSEVGDGCIGWVSFYYRYVCGNHIVWDATNVKSFRRKHLGNVREDAFLEMVTSIKGLKDNRLEDELLIRKAKAYELGTNKEEVVDLIFRSKSLLGKKVAESAFDLADKFIDIDGSPTTVWGFVNGLTRYSQSANNADTRNEIDTVGRKILSFAK